MIKSEELLQLSRDRLEDAKVLYRSGRIDWAVYTCGYVVEIALKRKICETLRWSGFPNSSKEFEQFKSFKTHDLNVLLHLSGAEERIREKMFQDWSKITFWDPEMRYVLRQTEEQARLLISAAERLLEEL